MEYVQYIEPDVIIPINVTVSTFQFESNYYVYKSYITRYTYLLTHMLAQQTTTRKNILGLSGLKLM